MPQDQVNSGEFRSPVLEPLFAPFDLNGLSLRNRIVMSPMTRGFARDGVIDARSVDYYRRRAEGGVGLIISEGTAVNRRGAFNAKVPDFFGQESLAMWRQVIDAVHEAGGRMMPQLWHAGLNRLRDQSHDPSLPSLSPSGLYPQMEGMPSSDGPPLEAMSQQQIDETIEDYATAAAAAQRIGFDGVEIHAGHGYLIDSFFWDLTNKRADRYGGDVRGRTRFAVEIIREVRRRVGPDFPIALRFSQWKSPDYYMARLCRSPRELEQLLTPLADAGVTLFDCSTRRFWEAEFPDEDADLNLAGWARKITGVAAMTVGSVGIGTPLQRDRPDRGDAQDDAICLTFRELGRRLERGDFDLVAVGRALIANPDWAEKVRQGSVSDLVRYDVQMRDELL